MRRITKRVLTVLAILPLLVAVQAAPAGATAPGYQARCMFEGYTNELTTIYGVGAWLVPGGNLMWGEDCQIGKARLYMQSDGNLVLYDNYGLARWATSWSRPDVIGNGKFSSFQHDDGNFVEYSAYPVFTPLWASNTCCLRGALLAIQADGNLVIYNGKNEPIWSTKTNH
jgi:hypothetical protein